MDEREQEEIHNGAGAAGSCRARYGRRRVFFGAHALANKLDDAVSLDFIKRTLRSHGRSKPHRKKESGRSKYMLYPVGFLDAIGASLMQMDFIGPRYIEGDETPIHFLSIRYVRPAKKQLFFRIQAPTTAETLRILSIVFFTLGLPLPDVIQQDNGSTFRGSIDQKGMVGRYIRWWCHNGVMVVFSAPRCPWNTGAVEGANSVFDRKFWKAHRFHSITEIDQKLQEFNAACAVYHGGDSPFWKVQAHMPSSPLKRIPGLENLRQPFLFLLRIVREDPYGNHTVEVLNRYIQLPATLKGQFVIVQIHLRDQWVAIWQERGDHTTLVRPRTACSVHIGNYGKKKKQQ
jgi:hypothetical protein